MSAADFCEVYASEDGWRWRAVARNGEIVADSGEAYTRSADAVRAAGAVMPDVRIVHDPERTEEP